MSELSISIGVDAPIELTLLALALAHEGGVLREEPVEGARLEVREGANLTTIESRAPSFHLFRAEHASEHPWFLPLNPPRVARTRSGRLRIAIEGGADSRRLKMSWRTLGELRARSVPVISLVAGRCDPATALEERPDEFHDALAPAEYLALLDRADLVLECTDSFGTESFLSIAAMCRGVPVVAHRDRPDLAVDSASRSATWSADGFVDALRASPIERRQPRSAEGPLLAIMDVIEGR